MARSRRADDQSTEHNSEYFSEQQWDEWFESYWSMLKRYATIARAESVEMLSMNCELISANNETRRWRELVEKTRKFVGKDVALTTSPNGHGHENWVEWFDVLDIIGVDWYDHINGTTLHEMVESWSPYLSQPSSSWMRHRRTVHTVLHRF